MHQILHLSDVEKRMIQQAIHRHRRIFPCGNKRELSECFTSERENVLFWYNTEDNSTHVLVSELATA